MSLLSSTNADPIINIANDEAAITASLLDTAAAPSASKCILFFWAEWHEPSSPGGAFDTVVRTLAAQQQQQQQQQQQGGGNGVQFYRVLAESAPRLSKKYNVTAVPSFLFLHADRSVLDRIDGGEDVARVTQSYAKLVNASPQPSSRGGQSSQPPLQQQQQSNEETQVQILNSRLKSLITSSPIMLFLKGTPTAPRCGFSRQAAELLTSPNLQFGYFNILEDEEVRQGLKKYSDWPTYPQLYVRGELVGGLDIMKELAEESGGLVKQLDLKDFVIDSSSGLATSGGSEAPVHKEEKKQPDAVPLNEKLQNLINRHRIMLFMKGIPSSPRCGFSRQIVEILDSYNVSYDAFNILEDEEVRQGLKEYSDWPTYPQLYVEGDLVGGLDIVKEMKEGGDLEDLLRGGGRD